MIAENGHGVQLILNTVINMFSHMYHTYVCIHINIELFDVMIRCDIIVSFIILNEIIRLQYYYCTLVLIITIIVCILHYSTTIK